ncbi:MAG: hypothetical protein HN617_14455 [Planctomycetaceae bacterium]|nr:hypothetical protein [Planctomycetaceae bacterium]MBT7918738.1 hypothetical protein [Planctomycetaceae bacterium]
MATAVLLQMIAPTWALNGLCDNTDASCAQGMDAMEDCVCAMPVATAAPTCCEAPEEPVTDTTSWHTVSSSTCDCYVQHNAPLLPTQNRVFSELVPVSFVCGFVSHSDNDQYAVAAKPTQVITPVSAMRMPRYAQIVLSVWLT